jgi:hypothetical protein
MAFDIDEANAVSSKYYDPGITDQVYEKDPFYKQLKASGNVSTDGGTQIEFAIKYQALNKAKFINPREQVTYEQKETRTAGVLDWTYLYAHAMISLDEQVKNTGKPQVVNLMGNKAEEMSDDMGEEYERALWATSQGVKDPVPLAVIVDDSTSYAGLAVADAAEWAATEDSTQTELVLFGSASLSYMMNQATFGPDKPTHHFTSRDLWSKFESLIEPQRRYYAEKSDLGRAGFTTLYWHQSEIISSYKCPAGAWFGLDMSKYEIRHHPDYNFKKTKWSKLDQAGYPYAMKKDCIWAGNICCKMRKTSFKFTALDYTI